METTSYKAALLRERAELVTQLTSLGALDHSVVGDWVSTPEEPITTEADDNLVADRMEAATERDGELAVLETRFAHVNRALEKIANGTFGTCELCDAAISPERLEANPAARTCTDHLNDEADLSN